MSMWTRDLFVSEDDDVGVKLSNLSAALQTWVMMRGQARPEASPCTVGEAMATFNTSMDVIEEAVREGYWLYQVGDGLTAKIGVDGE
jgi:hypothetical protein